MELAFIYSPVDDLASAIAFYRDQLGLDEAWREGDSTVAFALPGSSTQIMVSVDSAPPGRCTSSRMPLRGFRTIPTSR